MNRYGELFPIDYYLYLLEKSLISDVVTENTHFF